MQWVVEYRSKCNELPVRSTVEPDYLRALQPAEMPEQGEGWEAIMADLDTAIVPGLTHWESSQNFFAYFKPHSSYPAVLGEFLCAGLNVMGFDWIASPACTELELLMLDWLGRFLRLPERLLPHGPGRGGGVIQGSAGEAAIVVLLAAVQARTAAGCTRDQMVVYCSDQSHAIIEKACMVLGIGHLRTLETTREHNWTLQASALADALQQDVDAGLAPVACVATSGTTSTCTFDDLDSIADVCTAFDAWLHVDAAYGGAYACLPELAHLFRGLAKVDSFCVNCHKKMLCPFDLCALYVADRTPVLKALSLQPEYLRNAASESGAVVDYEHWQMPLGRRFRALKLWFVLRRYGASGLRQHMRTGIAHRRRLEGYIATEAALEIAVPPSLSLVCFRLKGLDNGGQLQFLDHVNAGGECFIIHTKVSGQVVLRIACGGLEQSTADIDGFWKVLKRKLCSFQFPAGASSAQHSMV